MRAYPELSNNCPTKTTSTPLYSLYPHKRDTGFVESQTGYIHRLAQEHQVVPKVLVKNVIRERFDTDESLGSVYGKAHAANGFGKVARKWVELLQEKTGVSNLQKTTLLPLEGVISQRNLLREQKAWCPRCFVGWFRNGNVLYEPLLWQLESVVVCPEHEIFLETKCPQCSETLPVLTGRSRIGVCPHCETWLGKDVNGTTDVPKEEYWVSQQFLRLLKQIQSMRRFEDNLVSRRVTSFVENQMDVTLASLARRMGLRKNTVWSWSKGRTKPTLRNLLKLCYVLGLCMDEFFTGEYNEDQVEFRRWEHQNDQRRKSPKEVKESKIKQQLEEVLKSADHSPSLRQVAQKTPHRPRILRRHFPDLCRAISEKYKYSRRKEFENEKQSVISTIRTVAESLHNQGIYPSKPKIEEQLSNPGYFHLPEIRDNWKQTLRELGYTP